MDADEIEFRQALKDMSNDLRLLCVAAHPDDEDGATLAYHRYKYGIKTFALIGTRGEGGQNEIGPELYEDLAVIRTKEMMEAAKIEGAELHFLDMPDFGFSKTIEETFEKWGKDVLLEKMVRKIREIRPHVIITHHGRMKDHGHHQAIGWAVQEAFDKAADKEYLPDGCESWQVQRLYIRDFTGGSTSAVVIDISECDELRGKTYAEIAAEALRAHKSQGMEIFIERLLSPGAKAYYDLVAGKVEGDQETFGPLMAGIENRIKPLEQQNLQDQQIPSDLLDAARYRPEAVVAMMQHLEQSTHDVIPQDKIVVPGQQVSVLVVSEVRKKLGGPFHNYGLCLDMSTIFGGDEWRVITVPETAKFDLPESQAIFSRQPTVTATDIEDWRTAQYEINSWGSDLHTSAVLAVHKDMGFSVAPPVTLEFLAAPYLVLPPLPESIDLRLRAANYSPIAVRADVHFTYPDGWRSNTETRTITFDCEDARDTTNFPLFLPTCVNYGLFEIKARVNDFYATANIHLIDLKLPDEYVAKEFPSGAYTAGRVGIVSSYDTTIERVLHHLHVPFHPITEKELVKKYLGGYTTIVIDMRAYGKRPDLRENNDELLEWCKGGGTLIVMYHKTQDWSSDFAPYPIILSNNRVTREDAPVKMLVPEHPWFNHPNKITPEDWDGWRQERGLYFPQQWDDAYTPLIETTDPGEHIPPGSCLIAKYGEGTYFYTSLVWYRQLRELHPGALKLFANMLAL